MMKILKSLSLVVAVAAVAGGATYALWSSQASITGNKFTSGSMDLKVDSNPASGAHQWVKTFNNTTVSLADLFPGFSSGEGQIVDLKNEGSVAGKATITFIVTGHEVSCLAAEGTGCNVNGPGNLPENLRVKVFYKQGSETSFAEVGDATLADWNSTYTNYALGNLQAQSGATDDESKLGNVKLVWYIPTSAGNEIMTDAADVDVEFGLTQ
ncbi:MAG: hypothetical protein HGB37_00035 [Candidatus Moranbacteria bacterium]|nr:hypothetical protein [Candidatus Moranbacteria bacterium]